MKCFKPKRFICDYKFEELRSGIGSVLKCVVRPILFTSHYMEMVRALIMLIANFRDGYVE